MDLVVILELSLDHRQNHAGIRQMVDPDIVAFEGFDEGFRDAVALRALDRCEAGREIERDSHIDGIGRGVDRAVVRQPCTGSGARNAPNLVSTHWIIRSRTISLEMPAVVATQPMASRSWQSSTKATRTTSPFQQVNSMPSEHQRMLERCSASINLRTCCLIGRCSRAFDCRLTPLHPRVAS
jgi:hypothetical protein